MTSIGIDLGTTNSAAAFAEGEEAEIIEIDSNTTMRSVLSFAKRVDGSQDEVIVGEGAVSYLETDPNDTVSAVKRHMGDDHPYEFEGEDMTYTPEMLSGLILKKLVQEAEGELAGDDTEIDEAVITVPARFSEAARNCTEAAAYFGYLERVPMLLPEPSAACVAYKVDDESTDVERVAVYDLGGGTFDISIVNIVPDKEGGNKYVVEKNDGRQQLGGEDFDERLRDWLIEQFEEESGIDVEGTHEETTTHQIKRRVQAEAKKVKEQLTNAKTVTANIPFLVAGETLEVEVTQEKFEDLTGDLVDDTIDICEGVLDDLDYSTDDIDTLLAVGGSTKMPQVQEAVKSFFDQDPIGGVNPDEAVALGAGEQADSIGPLPPGRRGGGEPSGKLPSPESEGDEGDDRVIPTTPADYGFELADGSLSVLIEDGMNLPVEGDEGGYTTVEDYQEEAVIRIFMINADDEAEKEAAKEDVEHPANEHVKTFTLSDIRRAEAGEPDINVKFQMDKSGVLRAQAWDTSVGEKASGESEVDIGSPGSEGDGGSDDGPYMPPTREEIIDGGLRDELPPVT